MLDAETTVFSLALAGFGLGVAAIFVFQVWMFVHAIRNREWFWAFIIFFGSGFGAALYFFFVYRNSATSSRGFELPGAATRARIQELQAKIHHLDKAHHHLELGDVYFRKGKFDKAEHCYRAALEREPGERDARAHLGQALLRQKHFQEARELLQQVCAEDPKHDYSHSMMAYAEALDALGEKEHAIAAWRKVLEGNSYARARVQLADLYAESNRFDEARRELYEVIADDVHAPKYQRKRDRVWIRRARALLRKIGPL